MNNHGRKKSREGKRFDRFKRRLMVEHLEARLPKDAALDSSLDLTISFVPDGTNIQGQASDLFAELGQIAPPADWQKIVVNAFEAWSEFIDANVTVVPDDGSDLGAEGESRNDPRFGDIRIAALPMMSDVYAIAIPRSADAGTWSGDILFNSDADLKNGDELLAVALHEAGHVLGLGHSENPNSPMYEYGIPLFNEPTPADVAELQAIYEEEPAEGESKSDNHSKDRKADHPGRGHGKHGHDDHGHDDVDDLLHDLARNVRITTQTSFLDRIGKHEAFDFSQGALSLLIVESLNSQRDLAEHTFEVSQPELMQFTLAANSEDDEDAIISALILTAEGELVDRLEVRSGESIESDSILLLPGEYSVVFEATSEDGGDIGATDVCFAGESDSSALGPQPSNPTNDPIAPRPQPYTSYPGYVLADPIIMPYVWYHDWYSLWKM